jgi:integrase
MERSLLREFVADWNLNGGSPRTANDYARYLENLFQIIKNPSLADVKEWLYSAQTVSVRRKRAQAIRAYGRWCAEAGVDEFIWWEQVPLVAEKITPQSTVTREVYASVLSRCITIRDKALIETLWSTGLRRAELERMQIEHLDLSGGFVVVPVTKAGRPRIVPLSPPAIKAVRRLIRQRTTGSIFQMTGNAIRLRLARLGAPSAHAWRRGWAVESLRSGVSEASVKAAAGWGSGAMVSRYTLALSGELAIEEFRLKWQKS